MHVLITGWFSFENMGTTAGDLMSKDVVCRWLEEAGIRYDVALAEAYREPATVDWRSVDPLIYSDLIFICGPFGNGWPVTELLSAFSHCRLTGINLSLLQRLNEWNPFTLLLERDHFETSFPDISLSCTSKKVPVAGVILAHRQKEYGSRALHEQANNAIQKLIDNRDMSVVQIDTALSPNKHGLRTAAEVESLIAAMDVVITTRLHGTVLALKNHVPVMPIDPISGGAKIALQVKALGWPILFIADNLDEKALMSSFEYCLTREARSEAAKCHELALKNIANRKKYFLGHIRQSDLLALKQEI